MDEYVLTKKEIKSMLRSELKRYMSEIGILTPGEERDLREWVAAGNSVYDNPYCFYREDGWPMDYITADRIAEDRRKNPGDLPQCS